MDFQFKKSSGLGLSHALALEWLETNGRGGYASSSIINCHTRKYHGLLISKLPNLPDKYVLLSKVEDTFAYNGDTYILSGHAYPNFLLDGSFDYFHEFSLDTHPVLVYQFDDCKVIKEIILLKGTDTVLLKYTIFNAAAAAQLQIRPLIAGRNFHALCRENGDLKQQTSPCKNGVSFAPYNGLPTLYLQSDTPHAYKSEPLWYRNFEYARERERGYAYQEDLFAPGVFVFDFKASNKPHEIVFACSLTEQQGFLPEQFHQEVVQRKNAAAKLIGTPLQKQLHKAGQTFIEEVPVTNQKAIIAGYPWFLEWGRDAMIALPGLTLYSGQADICLAVLKSFAAQEKQGLIPNFLGEKPEANAYNSVDAGLWFAWAAQQYFAKTQDIKGILQDLWPTLKNIFTHYKNGTLHNIKMQDNGLLYAGSPEVNVTWMDAMVNGAPVTPRYGLQVEVNALWYNMLCFMAELANAIRDPIKLEISPLVKTIPKTFLETFWNAKIGYLYDFVNAEQKNAALRPNQIFAISLPYALLPPKIALAVLQVVKEHLFTPYGLRTLSPQDPLYIGQYKGNQETRDRAYHNGAVWPWLLGHFGEALLNTLHDRHKVIKILRPAFEDLTAHLAEAGIGSISEIFTGDAYHEPHGCISQAWSVAEVLRLSYLLKMD